MEEEVVARELRAVHAVRSIGSLLVGGQRAAANRREGQARIERAFADAQRRALHEARGGQPARRVVEAEDAAAVGDEQPLARAVAVEVRQDRACRGAGGQREVDAPLLPATA